MSGTVLPDSHALMCNPATLSTPITYHAMITTYDAMLCSYATRDPRIVWYRSTLFPYCMLLGCSQHTCMCACVHVMRGAETRRCVARRLSKQTLETVKKQLRKVATRAALRNQMQPTTKSVHFVHCLYSISQCTFGVHVPLSGLCSNVSHAVQVRGYGTAVRYVPRFMPALVLVRRLSNESGI